MNSFFINMPLPLSILLFFIWIFVRIRKLWSKKSDIEKYPYKVSQLLGMAGIAVFIMPVLLVVILQINRLLPKIIIWSMYKIQIPEIVIGILYLLLYTAALLITFVATYLLCEMIWPKRSFDT